MPDATLLQALADDLCAAIAGPAAAWTPARFDALAQRLAEFQLARIAPWAALARARGHAPTDPWGALPAVPTLAFRRLELSAVPAEAATHRFQTSGTSSVQKGRVRMGAEGLRTMAASIRTNARTMLFPESSVPTTRLLVLAPPPQQVPHMIMAHGMAQLVAEHGLPGSRFLVGPHGLDRGALLQELTASSAGDGPPLTLIGASFGFVHLLDGLAEAGVRFRLPTGSRLMHAGGFKGRSRTVSEAELEAAFAEHLGLPPERCLNLLGMTELASQLYDNVLRDAAPHPRFKVCPPWVRTEVVDPTTLQPLPIGSRGLLRHTDLANLTHPFRVQTDDLGERLADGPDGERRVRIFGRATADGARGCSLTAEDLAEGTRP